MQESVTQDRWKYLGGSDIPSVMEISSFTKRFDLLTYKAQIAENDFQGNEYTEYGNKMEGKIRDYVNDGCPLGEYKEDKVIVPHEVIDWRYHSDGYNPQENTVLEIKTTSDIHENVNGYKVYLVQLLFGMYVHSAQDGMLAVYERPEDMSEEFDENRLQIFDIKMSDHLDLMQRILTAIDMFGKDLDYLMHNKEAKENDLPSRSMLMDISSDTYSLGESQYTAMFLLAHEKEFNEIISSIKDRIKCAMEERGIKSARFEDGTLISYVPAKEAEAKQVFDEKNFKEVHPDLYDEFITLKPGKGKSSYVTIRHAKN